MKKNPKKNNVADSANWSHKHDYPIEEVWNTENTLARLIAPRLVSFRDLKKHGAPDDFQDMRQWNNAIQKMIDAFELMKYVQSLSEEEDKTVSEGLELFCKYFRHCGIDRSRNNLKFSQLSSKKRIFAA